MISAIVLAAGLSSRMGGKNKLLLNYKGKTILQQTVESILASEVMEIVVVTGHQGDQVSQVLEEGEYPVRIVRNDDYKTGMTSSIKKGVENASQFCDGYMICMGDMPLIQTAHYNSIILAFRKAYVKNPKSIIVPVYDQRKGNPTLFSASYKNDILNHEKEEGCREIVESNLENVTSLSLSTDIQVLDVDEKEDYLALA